MSDVNQASNLPAPIVTAVAGIPAALVPACVKALDRLVGAAVDIPVAWLEYQKAKIVSRIEGFKTIDSAITVKAAAKAGANEQFSDRALDSLVRQSYRQLGNKEAVSAAMLEELHESVEHEIASETILPNTEPTAIDDDWLNVFERYAEDASTERMQKLWGRVLAGEVRKPGKFSMRTLRFLSEFSQTEALEFSTFCNNVFAGVAPKSLIEPSEDISSLLSMQAAGLIQGTDGVGLTITMKFDALGKSFLIEKPLVIVFFGEPHSSFQVEMVPLTPLGRELVSLLPGRNSLHAAKVVGMAMRSDKAKAGYIGTVQPNNTVTEIELLWGEQSSALAI